MTDKTQKRARETVKETILPALRNSIELLAADIEAETARQFSRAHAPELRVGARDAATNAILNELVRYLMQDDDASSAVTRWDHLMEDRIKRWFSN